MIRERFLHIENGCQHSSLDITFPDSGLISITGRNGIGKTNILRLNAYALTGVVDRAWGSQSDMSKDGTTGGFVQVELLDTVKGVPIKVRRHFTSSTRYPDMLWHTDMSEDAEPDIKGRQAVDAYLEVLYGVPMKILSQILWIRQGDITWLLTASKTSVDSFLKDVFDASKVDKIKEALWGAANSIVSYAVPEFDPDVLQNMLESTKQEVEALRKDIPVKQDEVEEVARKLEDIVSGLSGMVSPDMKTQRVTQARSVYEQAVGAVDKLRQELAVLTSALKVPTLTDQEQQFFDYYQKLLTTDYPELQNKLRIQTNRYEDWKSLVDRCKQEQESLQSQKENMLRVFSLHEQDKKCPLCSHEIEHTKTFKKNLKELTADKTSLAAIDKRIKELDSEIALLLADKHEELKEATELADAGRTYLEQGKAVYTALVSRKEQLEQQAKNEYRSKDIQNLINQWDSTVAQKKKELDNANSLVCGDSEKVKERDTLRAFHTQLSNEVLTMTKALSAKEEYIRNSEIKIKELREVQELYKFQESWRDALLELREATQNSRIPARFLKNKIEQLNKEMQVFSEIAHLDFFVELNTDTHQFEYIRNGAEHPAARLSGGEKSMAAVIVQLAVLNVVRPQLGVIAMDEPDAALFGENKFKMCEVLMAVRNSLLGTNGVALIATHDEDVMNCCSTNINVERVNEV